MHASLDGLSQTVESIVHWLNRFERQHDVGKKWKRKISADVKVNTKYSLIQNAE